VTSTSDLCRAEEIAYRQALERIVHNLAIETLDLMGPMLAAKQNGRFERMTFLHDFHWNASGDTIAAEALAAALQ
jgi:lysophospholipase L1-like esterase